MNKPTITGIEHRALGTLRSESQGDEMALVGYAATFDCLSQDVGGYRERIAPGAFARSLASLPDVKFLLNHDPNFVCGRTTSGSLVCAEDARGLKFRCQLDRNSTWHRDLWSSIKRGDINQCSFAFRVADGDGDEWDEAQENGVPFVRRTLRNVNLQDLSSVTYPAYNAPGATEVMARNAGSISDAQRRARAAAIGEQIRVERIAQAGRDAAEDLRWLARMAGIPRN